MVLDRGDSYLQSSQGYMTDVQVNLDHSSKQNTVVLQRFWQKYNKFGKKIGPITLHEISRKIKKLSNQLLK